MCIIIQKYYTRQPWATLGLPCMTYAPCTNVFLCSNQVKINLWTAWKKKTNHRNIYSVSGGGGGSCTPIYREDEKGRVNSELTLWLQALDFI